MRVKFQKSYAGEVSSVLFNYRQLKHLLKLLEINSFAGNLVVFCKVAQVWFNFYV